MLKSWRQNKNEKRGKKKKKEDSQANRKTDQHRLTDKETEK